MPHFDSTVRLAEVTPTIVFGGGAYGAGDAIGSAVLRVPGAARADGQLAILRSIVVIDNAHQNSTLTLYFYDRTVAVPTDNAAYNPTDADQAKLIGVVAIAAGTALTSNSYQVSFPNSGLGMPFRTRSGGAIYMVPVIGAAGGATYGAADDLLFRLLFEK